MSKSTHITIRVQRFNDGRGISEETFFNHPDDASLSGADQRHELAEKTRRMTLEALVYLSVREDKEAVG